MTQKQKAIPVTYDIYALYDDIPTSELLGTISETELKNLMQSMRNIINSDVPRCVRHMSFEYKHSMYIYPTPSDTDEYRNLSISGVTRRTRSMCTHAKWVVDDLYRPDKNCIKNLRDGKCKCPLMRTIGDLLWPNIYADSKQKTK